MSLDASIWAWRQRAGKSSAKVVLLALADRADAEHCSFPSIETLSKDSELNRKTVVAALQHLEERGLIRDTGKRKGATGRVVVYQLIGVGSRHESKQPQKRNSSKTGPVAGLSSCTDKQSQNRNDTENGTVPVFEANSTENGTLNSPKNGTQNLSVNHPIEPNDDGAREEFVASDPEYVTSDDLLDHERQLFDQPSSSVVPFPKAGADARKFPMFWKWEPHEHFAEHCRLARVNLAAFTPEQSEDILGEFRSYWISRDLEQTQSQWEHKLRTRLQMILAKGGGKPPAGPGGGGQSVDFDGDEWVDGVEEVL